MKTIILVALSTISLAATARTIACILVASLAVGMALVPAVSRSQAIELLETLNPDFSEEVTQNGNPSPNFGYSLAADGGVLVVGMPYFMLSESIQTGASDKFQRSGDSWQHIRRIGGTESRVDARCGWAVAIAVQDDTEYHEHVGCPMADYTEGLSNNGINLVFQKSRSWTISGAFSDYLLGASNDAAYQGDGEGIFVVGQPGGNAVHIGGTSHAAAIETTIFGTIGEGFGHSVAIAAGGTNTAPLWLAIGAPRRSGSEGAVYVYHFNQLSATWLQSALITLADAQANDRFGHSVAFHTGDNLLDPSDDLLVVGAPNRNSRGTVSVFRNDSLGNFSLEGDVVLNFTVCGNPSNCNQPMRFGHAVAIDDEQRIWIGAPLFDQDDDMDVGRAYMATWGPFLTQPDAWYARSILTPGALDDDCGAFGSGQQIGLFGWALAPVARGIAVGYPRRGCQTNTIPQQVGPRTGQVRIFGIPDALFSDRFE